MTLKSTMWQARSHENYPKIFFIDNDNIVGVQNSP